MVFASKLEPVQEFRQRAVAGAPEFARTFPSAEDRQRYEEVRACQDESMQ